MGIASDLFGKEIRMLEILSKYSLVFGILSEDRNTYVDVAVLNTDGTKTNTKLTVADTMYFTENGTMTIPARHYLDELYKVSDKELTDTVNKCIDGLLFKNWEEHDIDNEFNLLSKKIQNMSVVASNSIVQKTNVVGKILGQDDQNSYLYDLKKISKYIKCRVVKS